MPLPEEPLNESEAFARERLENLLGLKLQRVRPGQPGRRHDFEAIQDDGRVVAVEVTSRVDAHRRAQLAAIIERLPSFPLPGSAQLWMVNLLASAQVSKVRKVEIQRLLLDMEATSRWRAHYREDYRDPIVLRLRDLRIASVYAFDSRKAGRVVIGQDTSGGRGWYGSATDSWLADFLASEQGRSKLNKLNRITNAAQRHLAIALDPSTPEGIGIPLGLLDRDEPESFGEVLPSLIPPERLTHLWLLPVFETWDGLNWTRSEGWAVVPALRPISAKDGP
jgi:hypothetical protein